MSSRQSKQAKSPKVRQCRPLLIYRPPLAACLDWRLLAEMLKRPEENVQQPVRLLLLPTLV